MTRGAARAALLLAVAAASCSSRRDPPPAERGAPPPRITATSDGPRDASADATPTDAALDRAEIKRHMLAHFAAASELQRAIARGHLADAKWNAQWLLDHGEIALEGWQPFIDDLQKAARAVVAAKDLPAAGELAAKLGRTCSRCHEAKSAVVTFAWEPPLDEDPALAVQMKRHQWAAARLWEGLVGPSDEMWRDGAEVMAAAQLDAALAGSGAPRGDVQGMASKVRALAERARKLAGSDARAALYGELLATCAGCHQLVRPAPVPGP